MRSNSRYALVQNWVRYYYDCMWRSLAITYKEVNKTTGSFCTETISILLKRMRNYASRTEEVNKRTQPNNQNNRFNFQDGKK